MEVIERHKKVAYSLAWRRHEFVQRSSNPIPNPSDHTEYVHTAYTNGVPPRAQWIFDTPSIMFNLVYCHLKTVL
jgi:hypothetical protein